MASRAGLPPRPLAAPLIATLLLISGACAEDESEAALDPAFDASADAGSDAGPTTEPDVAWDFGSLPDAFVRQRIPTVTSVVPESGSVRGGSEVTILGLGFLHVHRVRFGGVDAAEWQVVGLDRILATTPPGPPGSVDVEVEAPLGNAVAVAAFSYLPDIAIHSIEPSMAPLGGGPRFTLKGTGLSRDAQVIIGANTAIGLEILSDTEAVGHFPPNPEGATDVWLFAGDGSEHAVRRAAVRYRAQARVLALTPVAGPVAGGTPVEAIGRGLEPDVDLVLGGRRVEAVFSGDGRRARFMTPPGIGPGTVDLSLHSPVGDASLMAAFTYDDGDTGELLVHGVRPGRGPEGGGNTVEVVVSFSSPLSRVSFGGVDADCVERHPGVLACEVPSHDVGSVDVSIKDEDGAGRLPGAYTYVPEVSVEAVLPATGAVSGSNIVTLRGSGFKVGATARFGPMESPSVRWISATTLTALTPPGTAGPADVTVTLPEGSSASLRDGFTYTDRFRLLALDPDHGARAGGTRIQLIGTGFSRGLVPFVGGQDALEVSLDGSTRLTMRTPRFEAGTVDVGIRGKVTLPSAYTYFNPESRYGGTWGHAIHGSTNLTALSSFTGDPIEGVFSMLGTDPAGTVQGTTDNRGQLVLSRTGLQGPVTITVGGEGYESQTFVAYDAENVTMYLTDLTPPSVGPPGPQPGPSLGIIRGIVTGIDKYVPEPEPPWVKLAYVETTRESIYRSNPDPGPGGRLNADGPYEIVSRPGDVAVVVRAGLFNEVSNEFIPYRLGVARFLYVQIDGTTEDADVDLSVALTRRIGVTLFDVPLGLDSGPDQVESTPWFEFRPEGLYGGYNRHLGSSFDFWLEDMPLWQSADFDDVQLHVQTVVSTEGTRPMSTRWDTELRWDLNFLDVGPFAGLPFLRDPAPDSVLQGNRFAWEVAGGVMPEVWSIRMMSLEFAPLWRVIMPGSMTSLRLPEVRAFPPFPDGRHYMTFAGGISPDFSMDGFEYGDLSVRSWDSWSTTWEIFRAAD